LIRRCVAPLHEGGYCRAAANTRRAIGGLDCALCALCAREVDADAARERRAARFVALFRAAKKSTRGGGKIVDRAPAAR
jgi:hypothetical protein